MVGSTICFCVRSRSIGCLQRHRFLTACLWGGQLADREERSNECDRWCFGLESLMQPSMFILSGADVNPPWFLFSPTPLMMWAPAYASFLQLKKDTFLHITLTLMEMLISIRTLLVAEPWIELGHLSYNCEHGNLCHCIAVTEIGPQFRVKF